MPDDEYGLSPKKTIRSIEAPVIDYLPPSPNDYAPKIGLIGAGGVSEFHLKNYAACGLDVVAIASRRRANAVKRRDQFFPNARVYDNYQDILTRTDIEVVDVTPHPQDRLPILIDSISAGKHVLSQKPFVLDLNDGDALVKLAIEKNVKLAVNQNGRWAPHFSYMRGAISSNLIGAITSIDFSLQWDQTWIAGNEAFESMNDLILFDFGIHWFDITSSMMNGQQAETVFATTTTFAGQIYRPPAIATAIIQYPSAQVRISLHGHTRMGEEDVTTVVGTKGTLRSRGPGLNDQPTMEVFLQDGQCKVPLQGCWFESGFQGAMGELLSAIEQDREPLHSAANNLKSLELCFAAIESAKSNRVTPVGSIRSI